MEFQAVTRRRRMVREFASEPLAAGVLERVLETALHAPSAGFAQGVEFVVLERAGEREDFWRLVDPGARRRGRESDPPVVVIPVANKLAYLRRYSQPDKRALGMDQESAWPVRYWELDAAMAVMLLLLAATDEGLGAWFFGLFGAERAVTEWLRIPAGCRPIGAVALGHPSPAERRRGSVLTRSRRGLDEVVHRGAWR